MATLNTTCPCGATMAYEGTQTEARLRAWNIVHAGHKAPTLAAQVEQLATVSALDVATVAELVKDTTAKINEWFPSLARGFEDRAAPPKRGTHLDVELQPGETITIRGREHPDQDPLIVLHGRLVTETGPREGNLFPTHLRLDDAYAVDWKPVV